MDETWSGAIFLTMNMRHAVAILATTGTRRPCCGVEMFSKTVSMEGLFDKDIAPPVDTLYIHSMKTVIRTWGNSLAIRIPKVFAVQMGIGSGNEVELSLEGSGLHIASVERNLERLLACVTPENLHGEMSTGSVVGREIW